MAKWQEFEFGNPHPVKGCTTKLPPGHMLPLTKALQDKSSLNSLWSDFNRHSHSVHNSLTTHTHKWWRFFIKLIGNQGAFVRVLVFPGRLCLGSYVRGAFVWGSFCSGALLSLYPGQLHVRALCVKNLLVGSMSMQVMQRLRIKLLLRNL